MGDPPGSPAEQEKVTRRYERVARFYDLYNGPMEWFGMARKRRRLFSRARGKVLEVGIGTGRNLEVYDRAIEVIGIDVSQKMLRRARRRAESLGRAVALEVADVQRLPFDDDSFETATAACVFCSVADPVRGLAELGRVVGPLGRILLLEHVRPRNPVLGKMADALSPVTRRLIGPYVNRRTEENVEAAGLEIVEVRRAGVWREIVARTAR